MQRKLSIPAKIFVYAFLIIGAFLCIYPILFTVLAGFFSRDEFNQRLSTLPLFPWPKNPTLENYALMFQSGGEISTAFLNSVIRLFYSSATAVLTSFLGGYVFSRLQFRGRTVVFLTLLATVMLPGTMMMIPTYIMYARFPFAGGNMVFTGGKGILDSFWVYLIGGPAINIMGTFIVMQSFDKIPKDMDEAAKIDGAGTFSIIFRVLFPMQVPILTYVGVTTAITVWNDWSTPFFYTNSARYQTLPGAISRLSSQLNSYSVPNYPLVIVLSLAITIPCLILFFIFQRYIVEGLGNVGIKG